MCSSSCSGVIPSNATWRRRSAAINSAPSGARVGAGTVAMAARISSQSASSSGRRSPYSGSIQSVQPAVPVASSGVAVRRLAAAHRSLGVASACSAYSRAARMVGRPFSSRADRAAAACSRSWWLGELYCAYRRRSASRSSASPIPLPLLLQGGAERGFGGLELRHGLVVEVERGDALLELMPEAVELATGLGRSPQRLQIGLGLVPVALGRLGAAAHGIALLDGRLVQAGRALRAGPPPLQFIEQGWQRVHGGGGEFGVLVTSTRPFGECGHRRLEP